MFINGQTDLTFLMSKYNSSNTWSFVLLSWLHSGNLTISDYFMTIRQFDMVLFHKAFFFILTDLKEYDTLK